jgi:DNA-binding PadR family transcriptional regulator
MLSTTDGAVLGLLAFGERSGYELAQLAEDSVAYLWTPSRSQIYKVLPRLVASGLAEAREVPQSGRPDKTLYRPTEAGSEALRSWLGEIDPAPDQGRVFALKLFFCDFASTEAARMLLTAYRDYLAARLDRYEALVPGSRLSGHRYPHHVLGHGLARVRATLAWVEETLAAIDAAGAEADQVSLP